jgi:Protein of unknown function (DUF1826)
LAARAVGDRVTMPLVEDSLQRRSRCRVAAAPMVLGEVRRDDVDVALWERELPSSLGGLTAWAASTDAPSQDRVVTIDSFAIAEVVSIVPALLRDALATDVSMLLGYFAAVSRATRCRLFFGLIRDDQCRKFHIDSVAMRMVTTYVGPGTEWLPERVVDRAALERMIACPSEANAAIVRDPDGVRRARCGDVLMLKGPARSRAGTKGAVHRSPPLREREVRLVLMATVGGPTP